MKIENIDILSDGVLNSADAICFTSNGVLNSRGELVMGAGVALQFKNKWPSLALSAGRSVKNNGNKCQIINEYGGVLIIAFPTKYHWRQPSDLELIKKSASELVRLADINNMTLVYLPCPGIKNGGLKFKDVIDILTPILDDRFIICTRDGDK